MTQSDIAISPSAKKITWVAGGPTDFDVVYSVSTDTDWHKQHNLNRQPITCQFNFRIFGH